MQFAVKVGWQWQGQPADHTSSGRPWENVRFALDEMCAKFKVQHQQPGVSIGDAAAPAIADTLDVIRPSMRRTATTSTGARSVRG